MNTTSHNAGLKFPAEPLNREEVMALMNQCSRTAPTGIRDRSLICTIWRSGLRISEALALKPADFDPMACTLRVLHGKGDRARVCAIDQLAVEILVAWMEVRRGLGIGNGSPIFCTLKGTPISTAQIREMIPRRAKKAGIAKRCHAHGMRHSFASDLADEGFELRVISESLGHQNLGTTERYIKALNPTVRIEALKARTW